MDCDDTAVDWTPFPWKFANSRCVYFLPSKELDGQRDTVEIELAYCAKSSKERPPLQRIPGTKKQLDASAIARSFPEVQDGIRWHLPVLKSKGGQQFEWWSVRVTREAEPDDVEMTDASTSKVTSAADANADAQARLEEQAEKARLEEQAEKARLEEQAEKARLEEQAEKARLEEQAEKARLEEQAEKARLEEQAEKARLEEQAEKTRRLEQEDRLRQEKEAEEELRRTQQEANLKAQQAVAQPGDTTPSSSSSSMVTARQEVASLSDRGPQSTMASTGPATTAASPTDLPASATGVFEAQQGTSPPANELEMLEGGSEEGMQIDSSPPQGPLASTTSLAAPIAAAVPGGNVATGGQPAEPSRSASGSAPGTKTPPTATRFGSTGPPRAPSTPHRSPTSTRSPSLLLRTSPRADATSGTSAAHAQGQGTPSGSPGRSSAATGLRSHLPAASTGSPSFAPEDAPMELGGNQDDGDLGGNGEGGGNDEIASPLTPHGPPRRLIVPDSSDEDDEPDSDDDATPTSTQVPATQVPATQTQSLRRLRRTRAQVKFKTSPAIQKQQLTDGEVLLRPSRRKMRRLRTAQARLGFAKHYLVQAKKLDASPEILDAIEAAGRAFIADAIPHITMTKRRIATRGPMGGKTSMDLLPFTRLYSNTELAHIVKHFSTSPSIFYCTDMDDAERIQVACPEYNGELCKQRGCYIVLAEWIKSADNRPTKSVVIRYPGIAIKQSIADRAKQHIAEMRRAERAFRSKDHAALEKYLGKHRGLYRPRLKRVVVLKLTGIGPDMPSTENECAEWMIERFPTPRCGRSFEGLADRCPGPHRDAFLVRVFIAWVEHFWASFYDSPRFRYDGVYWLDGYRFDHEEESGEKMIGGNSNAPKTSFLDIEGTEAKFYFSHQHQKLSTAQKDKIRQRAIREATLGATPATAADRAHDFDVATSAADNTGMVPPLLADTTAANEDVIEELTQKLAQSYFTSMADDLDDNDLVGTESDDEDYDPDDEPCFDDVDTQVPVRDGSGDVEGVDEGDEAEGAAARGMAFPEVPLNIYFKGRIHVVRFEDSPDPQVPFKPRLDEQTRHDAHSFTSLSDSTTTGSRTQRTLILPTTFPAERREAIWGRLSSGRTGLPCTIVGGGKRAHVDFGGATDKTPKFAFEVDLPSNLGFVDGPATFHMQPKPDGYECHPLAASPWASAVLSYFIVFFMQETMQGKLKWQYEPIAQIVDDPHWERGFIWLAEMASVKRLDFEIKYCQLPVEDARVANGIAVRLRQVCARFPLIDKGPLYRNWYISVPVPKPIMVELGTGRGRRAPESPVDSNAPEGEVYAELKISKKAGPHDLLLRVNQQPVGGYDHLYARVVKRDDTSPYPGDEGWEAVIPGGFLPKWSCHLFINLPRRAHGVAKDKLWLPGPSTS